MSDSFLDEGLYRDENDIWVCPDCEHEDYDPVILINQETQGRMVTVICEECGEEDSTIHVGVGIYLGEL